MRIATSKVIEENYKSSFMSCEKDQETIWKKLFIDTKDYSNKLKKLLVINSPHCLDPEHEEFNEEIKKYDLRKLREGQYIKVVPKLMFSDHEKVKSYILLEFDNFIPTDNPQYRDCLISFSIICHLDSWELDDYKLRPIQIASYIDGIMNEAHLSGIGKLEFIGAKQVILNEFLGGIVLQYRATHSDADDVEKVNNAIPAYTQTTNL